MVWLAGLWLVAAPAPAAAPGVELRGSATWRGDREIVAAFENLGELELVEGRVRFRGAVVNRGVLKVTDSEVRFEARYTGLGAYLSDPSDNHFNDLVIGSSGYLVGGEGDRFFVKGDFLSASAQNTLWNTVEAYLEFRTGLDSQHVVQLTGADLGPTLAGTSDNFAWGTLHIAAGNSLELVDGNAAAGGALYVREVTGAVLSGSDVSNVKALGAAPLHIYYEPAEPANAYLGSLSYDFDGNGQLIPIGATAVPVGSAWSHAVLALLILALAWGRLGRARPDGALA